MNYNAHIHHDAAIRLKHDAISLVQHWELKGEIVTTLNDGSSSIEYRRRGTYVWLCLEIDDDRPTHCIAYLYPNKNDLNVRTVNDHLLATFIDFMNLCKEKG